MLRALYRPLRRIYIGLHRPIYRYFFEINSSVTELFKRIAILEEALIEANKRISAERTATAELFWELSDRTQRHFADLRKEIAALGDETGAEARATADIMRQIVERLDKSQMTTFGALQAINLKISHMHDGPRSRAEIDPAKKSSPLPPGSPQVDEDSKRAGGT